MKSIFFSVLLLFSTSLIAKVCIINVSNFENPGRNCRTGDVARIIQLTKRATNTAVANYCNHNKSISTVNLGEKDGMSASCLFRNNKR